MRIVPLIALCATLVACGSWDRDSNGGGANLPNRGIIPYQVAMEPIPVDPDAGTPDAGDTGDAGSEDVATEQVAYVLENDDLRYLNPALVDIDDHLTLFVEVRERDANRIEFADSDDELATITEPALAIAAADLPEAWEADGRIGSPSAVFDGATWHVVFAYGREDGLGYASGPRPDALVVRPEALIVPLADIDARSVADPSLVRVDDRWYLYYVAEGEVDAGDGEVARTGPHVVLATAGDDLAFERVGVVWSRDLACPPAEGSGGGAADCWESDGVGSPEVRVGTSVAGRRIFRMFYSGGGDAASGIGFAGSFDGLVWSPFDYNPVIDEERDDEFGATNVFVGGHYLLAFNRDRNFGRQGVVRAINDRPTPSERF